MTNTKRQNEKDEATTRVMDSPSAILEAWFKGEFAQGAWRKSWVEEAVYYHIRKNRKVTKESAKDTAKAAAGRLRIPKENLRPGRDDAETLAWGEDPHRKR
jgi:hypothetical protein